MKIFICLSDYSNESLKILQETSAEVHLNSNKKRPDEDELCELVKEYDCLIIGAKEKMTEKVYKSASRLSIIGTLSIGIDHIDKAFIDDPKVKVINCPNSNIISVAEHTFALILALYKKIIVAHNSTVSLTGRSGLGGLPFDISYKTLGIIGAGRIAQSVIKIAQIFNMKIYCYTFHPENHTELEKLGVTFVDLETIFKSSDIVTIHVPLTENTRQLISKALIDMMKSKAILINTSRVDIVDNEALGYALSENRIFGAAIDLDIESKTVIDLMKDKSSIILTPHTAGITLDSIIRMDTELANYLVNEIVN